MRVIKERDGGIVRRVRLVDDEGELVGPVCRFLDHLRNREFSPNTLSAYGYDLKYLFTFLDREGLNWQDFRAPHMLAGLPSTYLPTAGGRDFCCLISACRLPASSSKVSPQRTLEKPLFLGTKLTRMATQPPDMSVICQPGNLLSTCCTVRDTAGLRRSAMRAGVTCAVPCSEGRLGGRRGPAL